EQVVVPVHDVEAAFRTGAHLERGGPGIGGGEDVGAHGAGHADGDPGGAVEDQAVLVAQLAGALAHELEAVPVLLGQEARRVEVAARRGGGTGAVEAVGLLGGGTLPQVAILGQGIVNVVAAAAQDAVLGVGAVAHGVVGVRASGGAGLEELPVLHLADAMG